MIGRSGPGAGRVLIGSGQGLREPNTAVLPVLGRRLDHFRDTRTRRPARSRGARACEPWSDSDRESDPPWHSLVAVCGVAANDRQTPAGSAFTVRTASFGHTTARLHLLAPHNAIRIYGIAKYVKLYSDKSGNKALPLSGRKGLVVAVSLG